MDLQVSWFRHQVIECGMLSPDDWESLAEQLDPEADILTFGQALLDCGLCSDFSQLQDLVYSADMLSKQGYPPPEISGPTPAAASHYMAEPEPERYSAPRPVPAAAVDLPGLENIMSLPDQQVASIMADILLHARAVDASDLHVSAGAPLFTRRNRQVHKLSSEPLDPDVAERLITSLLSPEQTEILRETGDLDIALELDESSRFRVNLMHHKTGYAGTYRLVANEVYTLKDLGFTNENVISKLLDHHNGLILVTGPVGSGKTTTLATLIQMINTRRQDHIITVEDPIEIIQRDATCNVTQRQVGAHTMSFHSALKGALREDPDIIVIGELRDLETIEMAITAAETGHLVIGTLHTSDAATTLSRLLDVFPPAQQAQIRAMTAESLRGVICQKLLPTVAGGLTVACEVLINTLAVASMIRDNKTHQLKSLMQTGIALGMCTMDNSIFGLYAQGVISEEVALQNMDKTEFQTYQNSHQAAAQAAELAELSGKKKGWLR